MAISSIPLFALLTDRMSWLSARQSVLAENVANAETPEYKAQDLKPMDFESLIPASVPAPTLAMTNPRHLALPTENTGFEVVDAAGEDGSPRGPAVSLEEEMIKLSDTQIQYQTATNLYQKAVGMFRTALGA
jgi:flagellar basal-body rod protein FlgB